METTVDCEQPVNTGRSNTGGDPESPTPADRPEGREDPVAPTDQNVAARPTGEPAHHDAAAAQPQPRATPDAPNPTGAPHHHIDRLTGKELLAATRPFAVEIPLKSWWTVLSTVAGVAVTLFVAAIAPWWPLRLFVSILGGLLLVRSFILFHDFMHGSLLRNSRLARPLFQVIGLVLLSPSRYWRYSHNHHHGHVGKPTKPAHPDENPEFLVTSDLGSFPLMTTEAWARAGFWRRLHYRVVRHPLTLALAYLTVFLVGLTILPFIRNPRKYWDGVLSLLTHAAIVVTLWVFLGFWTLFFAFLLPYAIAAAIGAYLFYAQHNYEDMQILAPEEWTYYRGAIESSSYMKLGHVMDWFTGNIGYHHVHHMNPLIPFYRLPEAMAAIPQLQEAGKTSLSPRDVFGCLRLNLWDAEHGRLVGYGAARPPA